MGDVDGPLTRYFALLDGGDTDGCAALFAPDALLIRQALGTGGELRPGVDVLRGREAVRSYVRARGVRPYHHAIRREMGDASAVAVDGVVRTDGGEVTSIFLASADLDAEGRFTRYLAVGTPVDAVADDVVGGRAVDGGV